MRGPLNEVKTPMGPVTPRILPHTGADPMPEASLFPIHRGEN